TEAVPVLRRALGLLGRPQDARPRIVRAQLVLAECLLEGRGDPAEADALLSAAYERLRPLPGREAEKLRALDALVRVQELTGNDALRRRYAAHLEALGGRQGPPGGG
ncbi:MAG TPA: hypothetical protein VK849_04030, partial [Longimicrobiales bacterium]|nr:hypothetical protein [Longimicrobiales bacterium]